MPDFPDYDGPFQDPGIHAGNRGNGPGLEPIPEFDRAETVTLQVEILRETYDELLDVLLANEWERDEGLRMVITTGLGYLDAKLKLDHVTRAGSPGDPQVADRMEAVVKDLAAYHSMYSALKFKAYKLYKVNQVLEFNVSGLRAIEQTWGGWAERMRREHDELRTEVIRLRALMSEFKLDWDQPSFHSVLQVEQAEPVTRPDFPAPPLEGSGEHPSEPPPARISPWQKFRDWLRGI